MPFPVRVFPALVLAPFLALTAPPRLAAQTQKSAPSADKSLVERYARQRLEYAAGAGYNPFLPSSSDAGKFNSLIKQKKHQEALGLVDTWLEKNPVSPRLRMLRSTALRHLGRLAEAAGETKIIRALDEATALNFTAASYDTAYDTILQSDPESIARVLKRKIVRERKETRDGHNYSIYAMKWEVDTSANAETRDYYFNMDRLETWRKNNPKAAPRGSVKIGAATVVGDDSAPKLISTTGGAGGAGGAGGDDGKSWANFEALQKAAAAQNPDALYELGIIYLQGTPDTPKNIARALLHLDDAARLGQRDAHFRLGKLYADGDEAPRDYAKALAHYTAAARAGDPLAQHNLGAMLASGRGVTRDYTEGLAWMILAARKDADAAESEKKLRAHLATRPAWIAAAEKRAGELEKELAAAPPPARARPAPPQMEIAPIAPKSIPIAPLPPPVISPN